MPKQSSKIVPTGELALIKIIRDAIRRRGPVSFAWFMEQALYHPQHGYYSSGRCAIGRAGDYFTSVSVGPLFGEMLAAQFAEMWERLEWPANFTIVEQGAHHGEFAGDVLAALHKTRPEFLAALRYRIVEPFPVLRVRQANTLSSFEPKVEWRDSLEDMDPFVGVHFSNELFDALPVHLLCSRQPAADAADAAETQWNEKFVGLRGDEFVFVEQSIVDPVLRAQLHCLPSRPAGYETEISLAALELIESISRRLERGYILAVDYGHPREEYYAQARTGGTLQCRVRHRLIRSPFEEIGRADLTAHVEWTGIVDRARDCGLIVAGFTDQHHFLTGILSGLLRDQFGERADAKKRRALQTLLHPNFLGITFQVLGLSRNLASDSVLSGFSFARPSFLE